MSGRRRGRRQGRERKDGKRDRSWRKRNRDWRKGKRERVSERETGMGRENEIKRDMSGRKKREREREREKR